MNTVQQLIHEIGVSRSTYISQILSLTDQQANYKPEENVWSAIENTEHLFWAEQGGILGMWKSLLTIREGKMERKLESIHQNMPIEQIIDLTWKQKEIVPAIAAPRFGGPLKFWIESLNSLQNILEAFGADLQDSELRIQAHPHPISGPMDFQQRLEFLRFHIDRHTAQVKNLLNI